MHGPTNVKNVFAFVVYSILATCAESLSFALSKQTCSSWAF